MLKDDLARWNRGPVTARGYRQGLRPPNYGKKYPPEVLRPEEVGRLLAACSKRGRTGVRNRAIIVVLWRGGLRIAEALALELRDVDPDRGTVTIRHGKGNKRRVVGLDPAAMAIVEQWLAVRAKIPGIAPRSGLLFCCHSKGTVGRRVHPAYFRDFMTKLGKKADIDKHVHPHGLRHTFAVELLLEGKDLVKIMKALGHNSLETTYRYINYLLPADVVDAMQQREWPAAVSHAPALLAA